MFQNIIRKFSDKSKKVIKNILTNPDRDDPVSAKIRLRKYKQFCCILSAAFFIMSLANVFQHSTMMLYTTLTGGVIAAFAAVLCFITRNKSLVVKLMNLSLITLFSAYAVIGGNHGFAILWIMLVPSASMLIEELKDGILFSTYFLVFLYVLFYTPLKQFVMYDYGSTFLLRFPLLYTLAYVASFYGFYKLHVARIDSVQQQKHLMELQQEAENANTAKSQFLANMSHEIRTPINGILGMDTMLMKECEDKTLLEYAGNIESASRTLLSIVNDILDISKIESGKLEIIPVEYELFSILNDCYNMNLPRATDKGLEFELDIKPGIPYRLFGDEIRIRQIINNLLSNAAKYTKEGSFKLTLDYTPDKENSDILQMIIKVSDTGMGIRKEDMDKLFASFTRLDEKENRSIEGTGLGLNLTQRLIDMMDGTIDVESEYGRGSVFTVKLPQKILDSKPMGNFSELYHSKLVASAKEEFTYTAPKAHILVVDDVEMNLKVMKGLLKSTLMFIDTATSGQACLDLISKNHYDIIFLDHMMPHMDGVVTFENMKKTQNNLCKDTPVIMLTANAIAGVREEYLDLGFTDYLSKPVQEAELHEFILKYLPKELILDGSADISAKKTGNKGPAKVNNTASPAVTPSNKSANATSESINTPNLTESASSVSMSNSNKTKAAEADSMSNSDKTKAAEADFKDTEIDQSKLIAALEKNIPGLDTGTGLSYAMDSPDFYLELIHDYGYENKLNELTRLFENKDWENYRINAHSIKSTSASVGLSEISEEFKKLEFACRDNDTAYILSSHDGACKKYEHTIKLIKNILP